MKPLSVLLVILALVLILLPEFTDCQSQGLSVTLANGTQIPMKCHWSGRAEVAVGIPLLILGIALFTSEKKNLRRLIGILAAAMGILGILLPTSLIGVCRTAEMSCNAVMRPGLIFASIGIILIGAAVFALSIERKAD